MSAAQIPQGTPPRPSPLPVAFEGIPDALKEARAWVVWKYELRGEKWTKAPYRADGAGNAKTNDPSTWATFEDARQAYEAGGWDGVGLIVTDDLVGIDLDHVLDQATEDCEEWAVPILERFWQAGAYIERSPGGDGVRVFCRGEVARSGKAGPENRLEVYGRGSPRYLTVTGQTYSTPPGAVVPAQGALDWLHAEFFEPKAAAKAAPERPRGNLESLQYEVTAPTSPPPSPPPSAPNALADDDVLRLASRAKNAAKFNRLWSGDAGGDPSQADAALVGALAFYTKDEDQLDRLFRRSGLMRAKWDEMRGPATYGARTIAHVLAGGGETFGGRAEVPLVVSPLAHPLSRTVDLSAKPQAPRWVVRGFFAEGVTVLSGAAGVGKTSVLLTLVLIVAGIIRGLMVAALAPKHWRQVVWISEAPEQVRNILAAMEGAGVVDMAEVAERFHLVPAVRMDAAEVVKVGALYMEQWARQVDGQTIKPLVVIDTKAATFKVAEENNNAEASEMVAALKQSFAGLPVWLVGHLPKVSANEKNTGNLSARGAGAIEADAETTAYIVKDGAMRRLELAKVRYVPRFTELCFDATLETVELPDQWGAVEHVQVRWCTVSPHTKSRQEATEWDAEDESREAILQAVERAHAEGNPLSRSAVPQKAGIRPASAKPIVDALVDDSWLWEVEVPKDRRINNRKTHYLVRMSEDEREGFMADGTLPQRFNAHPPTWAKPPLDDRFKAFECAWWSSGAEDREGAPFVTRSALGEHLTQNRGLPGLKVEAEVSGPGGLIADLVKAKVIEAIGSDGWQVVNKDRARSLIERRSS
jgi:hypothetical protein